MATENEKQRIVTTIVPGEAEGIRLDQYLANRFTYRSRTVWQRCIRSGEILLNGRKTASSRPVHSGEVIIFIPPEEDLIEPPVRTDYTILAETDDFLVVNKPGNLPVHPSGCYFNHTLQRLLSADLGKIVHPVNRLDRETSGVVLFAAEKRRNWLIFLPQGRGRSGRLIMRSCSEIFPIRYRRKVFSVPIRIQRSTKNRSSSSKKMFPSLRML